MNETGRKDNRDIKEWNHFMDVSDLILLYQQGRLGHYHLGQAVASRIKGDADFCQEFEADVELNKILTNFENIENIDHFDAILNDLYDWADLDQRLFIKTFPNPQV